ncbi:MAG: septal ring lytic transglycosylase RlpA family protein [Pseudanabaenaceae cyanobacterium bins.68]|nr:septal ring lytic transglycosylase RlpA family protein [Pseudanabaenaceae cyanobacterium bins.68]
MLKKYWAPCLTALVSLSAIQGIPSLVNAQNLKVGESRSQGLARSQQQAIATVVAHKFGNQNAATVYVRGVPVISVTSNQDITAAEQKIKMAHLPTLTPFDRATNIAATLNYLNLNGFDPQLIVADVDTQFPSIKLGNKGHIRLSASLIAASSSGNPQQDAIAAAKLLRNLMTSPQPIAAAPVRATTRPSRPQISGMASWYGADFHGRLSASGEVFNKFQLTAAHRSLPFGTRVRVTNLQNGRSVVVRINDRGPFYGDRILDVSKAAASALGFIDHGVARVKVEVLDSSQGV